MHNTTHIARLLKKRLTESLTAEEEQELHLWAGSEKAYQQLLERTSDGHTIPQLLRLREELERADRQDYNRLLRETVQARITDTSVSTKSKQIRHWLPYIAASIILFIAFGLGIYRYMYTDNASMNDNGGVIGTAQDISPARNKAVLSVSGGEDIELGEHSIVTTEGMVKYADGELVTVTDVLQQLTLRTPAAGQYKMTLPDGSLVWLNAQSKIEYPSRFDPDMRKVKVEGEVYFEVQKDKDRPFIVDVDGQEIRVLGTAFNVENYKKGALVKTTLVEGKIAIQAGEEKIVLHPNQESRWTQTGFRVSDVDTRIATAWKDGYFRFSSTPIREALEQIQRWYDIEVSYGDFPANIRLHAIVSRDKKLSSVLYAIEEASGIQFKLEGRRLSVK